jgi:phospholipid/cholesterol/gamma-HCH transport system substrate-binding protein
MSKRDLAVGVFIIVGLALFATGIFLIGNRHEAFAKYVLLYTEFADLGGISKGSKVQVAGMDAGQVTKIDVPQSPSGRFRVKMKIDEQFAGLVRTDSFVSVDTEGVVGNTFLTIHPGSPGAPIAGSESILNGKAPVNVADLLSHGLVLMNDADATLKQLGGKIDVALDGVNGAVINANDLLTGLKEGRGPAGMLLRDENLASHLRETMANVQSTTANLNRASTQVNGIVADVQQRQLPQKLDETMTQINSASSQANATVGQVRQSLAQALGPDINGITAAQNINETLSNLNAATGNIAEDTEALKHNFFFRGFFARRGYYTLSSLSPQEYRRSKLFGNPHSPRAWLQATALFQAVPKGGEELSLEGRRSIDAFVASMGDAIFKFPIVIEGYSDATAPADALSISYARAQIVRVYLEARYPFVAKNVGVMALSGTPPPGTEHDRWSGISILIAEKE